MARKSARSSKKTRRFMYDDGEEKGLTKAVGSPLKNSTSNSQDLYSMFFVGQRIEKYFPRSTSNPTPAYYQGTITLIAMNNVARVLYDDEDTENLGLSDLKVLLQKGEVRLLSTTSHPTPRAQAAAAAAASDDDGGRSSTKNVVTEGSDSDEHSGETGTVEDYVVVNKVVKTSSDPSDDEDDIFGSVGDDDPNATSDNEDDIFGSDGDHNPNGRSDDEEDIFGSDDEEGKSIFGDDFEAAPGKFNEVEFEDLFGPEITSPRKMQKITGTRQRIPHSVIEDTGLQIKITHQEPPKDQYFLKWLFKDRLTIRTQCLQDITPLETSYRESGRKYQLVCRKYQKNAGKSVKYESSEREIIKAFYVAESGPGLETISAQQWLEAIGDFASLQDHKVDARMELLVSKAKTAPPRKYTNAESKRSYSYHSLLSVDDVEEIEERGNDGCGFIPESLLVRLLGPKEGATTTAIQVRLVIPSLGIFKGVLEKKIGISRIQLPPSMKKVGPSKSIIAPQGFPDFEVYIVTIKCFPSAANSALHRVFDLNATRSDIKLLEPLKEFDEMILRYNGVSDEVLDDYEQRRKSTPGHASFVGLADPSSNLAIPSGMVYLTGSVPLDSGSPDDQLVFVTRSPGSEKKDGKLLRRLCRRPKAMSMAEWNDLEERPTGFIIFGAPDVGEPSLPSQINDSDLDGDLFKVIWDPQIIAAVCQNYSEEDNNETTNASGKEADDPMLDKPDDDLDLGVTFRLMHSGKWHKACIAHYDRRLKKYAVDLNDADKTRCFMDKEEILNGRTFVKGVTNHRNANHGQPRVEVEYCNGKREWLWLQDAKEDCPDALEKYVEIHQDLLNHKGWKSLNQGLTYIREVIGHDGEFVTILYEDGSSEKCSIKDLKDDEDDKPKLVAYYVKNPCLEKNEHWSWVRTEKLDLEWRAEWLDRAQEYIADIATMKLYYKLRKDLCSRFKKLYNSEHFGPDDPSTRELGKAYKRSNDIQKHGGTVGLPFHLLHHIDPNLHKYCY